MGPQPAAVRPWRLAGHLAIGGGFLLHLTLGTLYCFGNMNTYMTSYLRTHVPAQVCIGEIRPKYFGAKKLSGSELRCKNQNRRS